MQTMTDPLTGSQVAAHCTEQHGIYLMFLSVHAGSVGLRCGDSGGAIQKLDGRICRTIGMDVGDLA